MSQREIKIHKSWQWVPAPFEQLPCLETTFQHGTLDSGRVPAYSYLQTNALKCKLELRTLTSNVQPSLNDTADSLQVAKLISCQDRSNFEVIWKKNVKCNFEGPRMMSFLNLPYGLGMCSKFLQPFSTMIFAFADSE